MAEDTLLETETQPAGQQTGIPGDHWVNDYEFSDDSKNILSKFETPGKAFEAHVNLEKLRGRSISLPKDDAPPEEKTKRLGEIYGKLGRPDTPDGYKLEKPTELPDGLQWSDETAGEFKKIAHSLGLNQTQMDTLVKFDTARQIKSVEMARGAKQEAEGNRAAEEKAKTDKALGELKKEWGEDFDKKIECAEKAYAVFGKNLEERARFFYQVYLDRLAEDTLIPSGRQTAEAADFFAYKGMARK